MKPSTQEFLTRLFHEVFPTAAPAEVYADTPEGHGLYVCTQLGCGIRAKLQAPRECDLHPGVPMTLVFRQEVSHPAPISLDRDSSGLRHFRGGRMI